MGVGDWFLARSQAFQILIDKFRSHKANTQRSFAKVRTRHNAYEYLLEGHEARLKEIESLLSGLKEKEITQIKKKR